jgi:stage II sporulation protein AA (anti-sigma F factor antagonist)
LIPDTSVRTALRVVPRSVGFRSVLSVQGEIDIATAGSLRSALERARESGRRDIWVDLSEVTFMDSSGLNALVRADHDCAAHNVRLTVICPAGPVRRTLELTGLVHALNVQASRSDAQLRQ